MIIDKLAEFCSATTVDGTASPTTALLGSQVDLGVATSDIGIGEDMWLVIQTTTEIITGGSAGSIVFKLVSDDSASIATNGTATEHLISPTYVTDDSAANSAQLNVGGVILAARLPSGTYERYLGILVTRTTTAVTAGAINAFLTKDYPRNYLYANAI